MTVDYQDWWALASARERTGMTSSNIAQPPSSSSLMMATPESEHPPRPPLIAHKALLTPAQLESFQTSPTHAAIVDYISRLNEAIVGVRLSDVNQSDDHNDGAIRAILDILSAVTRIAQDTPPVQNSASRFGNPAFRTFYDRVQVAVDKDSLHDTLIPYISWPALNALSPPTQLRVKKLALKMISPYFVDSFGNRTRIDYGSGMELNFLCWLLALSRLGVLHSPDKDREQSRKVVLTVFWGYLTLMRLIQRTYWLEPAGSHGVWGLDDYHFLPFLWGSGQVRGHKYIRPRSIHDPEIVEEYAKEYMYFECIREVNSIKTASLRWHSPMLDDISAVKTWDKVNEGMMKMFKAEVLGKVVVMQHFLFTPMTGFGIRKGNGNGDSAITTNDPETDEDLLRYLPELLPYTGPPPEVSSDSDPHAGHAHPHAHSVPLGGAMSGGVLAGGVLSGGTSSNANGTKGGHNHSHESGPGASQHASGWGDCCGIPVPSAFAAAAANAGAAGTLEGERNKLRTLPGGGQGQGLVLGGRAGIRPVPFD